MCQAYEGEARFVQAMEDRATVAGYEAHGDGKTLCDCPYLKWDVMEKEAWRRGWEAAKHGCVPYAVELKRKEK